MKVSYLLIAITLIITSCSTTVKTNTNTPTRTDQVQQVAQRFFDTFAERSDWDKLLSYYREDMEFQDVMLQLKLDSLWQFKRFYKWDEEGNNFKKLTPEQEHLTVYSLVANDSVAVAHGRFNPFYYYDQLVDSDWGMDFTIWLYLDQDLKIYRQIDWIEYDPEVLKSVIKRCETFGHEATPEWLDLSR